MATNTPQIVASSFEPIKEDKCQMAPNSNTEKFKLWTSQVMLPFIIGSSTYSFLGPFFSLPSTLEIQPFFRCSKKQEILITQESIHIDYFNKWLAPKNSNSFIDW